MTTTRALPQLTTLQANSERNQAKEMSTIENQNQWKCRGCLEVFDTRGKRDAHHRKMHQTVVGEGSGSTNTQRSVDGKFVCECGLRYNVAQSLKRHKRSCYSAIAVVEGQDVEQEQRIFLNYM